ncbi:unnamed protein product [Dovyalis caffra]|uniref:Uncharacterized protein n=1 Tax=Dovyalis caffra TaxID=77055 RepID=A0AAV1RPQ4_9ROSI|nr:unnamed protein product [Dovyalis caffra]
MATTTLTTTQIGGEVFQDEILLTLIATRKQLIKLEKPRFDHEKRDQVFHDQKLFVREAQSNNIYVADEALNQIYTEEKDYKRFHKSIDLHDNLDQTRLAYKVGQHESIEVRHVSTCTYKKAERCWKSLDYQNMTTFIKVR